MGGRRLSRSHCSLLISDSRFTADAAPGGGMLPANSSAPEVGYYTPLALQVTMPMVMSAVISNGNHLFQDALVIEQCNHTSNMLLNGWFTKKVSSFPTDCINVKGWISQDDGFTSVSNYFFHSAKIQKMLLVFSVLKTDFGHKFEHKSHSRSFYRDISVYRKILHSLPPINWNISASFTLYNSLITPPGGITA